MTTHTAWREWFQTSAIAPLGVLYEDLVSDMTGTTAAVLGFLGMELPAEYVTTPAARRQADEVNQEWAERYRSLSSRRG
ncbi:MAG TPA: Stf0 family sulfotransferase [Acidimicrobiales bacterium]|nr:Stf0 family sulfotransferase [Acidimicrobiales bacterium]